MRNSDKSGDMSDVEHEIAKASDHGEISCRKALQLAENLQVPPRAVGDAADRTGVKITSCQLGCFGNSKQKKQSLQ